MSDFGLFDDDLTVAEATLLVAAIDEDPDDGPADPGALGAGARPGRSGGRRSAGCGCLLAAVAQSALVVVVAVAAVLAVPAGHLAWFRPMC